MDDPLKVVGNTGRYPMDFYSPREPLLLKSKDADDPRDSEVGSRENNNAEPGHFNF